MSKTRSEAERLLNTIVSSRVRLSALQGDPSATVQPSMVEEAKESTEITVPKTKTILGHDNSDPFDELPVEDDLTDFEDPPMVLGIEPEADELPQEDTSPPSVESTNAQNDTDMPWDSRVTAQGSANNSGHQSRDFDQEVRDTDQSDPFSFIDLIPPDSDVNATREPSPELAPPVRTKPLMPLPSAAAAGAPSATPSAQEAPSRNEADWENALSTDGLTKPREVAPRILDPDRSQLEVDVFVEEEEPLPIQLDDDLPQLTDTAQARTQSNAAHPKAEQPQRESVFDLITEGMGAIERGDIQTAALLLSDALDWEPTHIEARLARGRCLRDRGDITGAMSDFLKAEKIAPHSCEPHVEIGNLFFVKKEYGRAIIHYTEALSIHPEHAMALCRRGISFHHRRQFSQAIDDLKGAQILNPTIPNIERYIRMVAGKKQMPTKRH